MKLIGMVVVAVALTGCVRPATAPHEDADTCGAQAATALVGGALPKGFAPPVPSRVFRSGDALTMDFRAERINYELDPASLRVVRVFCG